MADQQERIHGSTRPNPVVAADLHELARTGQLSAAVLAALPGMAVLVYDRDLRFVLASGQALERHGRSGPSMEGRTLAEVTTPEQLALLEPHYRATLAGEVV